MKYLIITISIALNIVFVIFFLQRSDNVTNVYSTKVDGTPIYKERLEMPSGEVSERVLIDGALIKESIFFSDGTLKEIRNYKNNQKHGDWTTYYKNEDSGNKERKKQSSYYNNGKLTELVQYNYAGSLTKLSSLLSMSESTYMIYNYYPNGQIQSAGRIRQTEEGKQDKYGIWIIYDEQGFVRQEKSYN